MLSLDAFDVCNMKFAKQIRKLADAKTTSEFSEVSPNFHLGKQNNPGRELFQNLFIMEL